MIAACVLLDVNMSDSSMYVRQSVCYTCRLEAIMHGAQFDIIRPANERLCDAEPASHAALGTAPMVIAYHGGSVKCRMTCGFSVTQSLIGGSNNIKLGAIVASNLHVCIL